jgi:dTMP kinase
MTPELLNQFGPYHEASEDSFFISFEGIEGAGKTTQINLVKEYFTKAGYTVSQFREPGGTTIGEKLREAILQSEESLSPLTEAHIFCAARSELMNKLVLPKLEQSKNVVILDRFIDSSLAYQGMARGLGMETILELHSHYPLNIQPHLTFYLKIDLKTSMHRQSMRGNNKDYFEKENHDFYQKLIEGYDKSAAVFKNRIKTIDATQELDQVSTQLLTKVKELCGG